MIKGRTWGREGNRTGNKGIKEELGKEVKIGKAYKITNRKKSKIIIATLEDWQQKREVTTKKKDLKRGIWIEDDLTWKEREIQKKLRKKAKEEREKGNKVRVGYMKIQIGEEWYRWNERKERLVEEKRRA